MDKSANTVENRPAEALGSGDELKTHIALEADVAKLREALEICLEELYAPDPNCSCHICAPCSDCVEYNSIREARELALAALEARNG